VIGSLLRVFRGDGIDDVSPAQRSLSRFAAERQRRATAAAPGAGWEPSRFAIELLAGGRE
jgi:hypothetical protein